MSDATDARPTRLRKKTAKATEAEEAIAGGDATPPADPDVLIHGHVDLARPVVFAALSTSCTAYAW